MGMIQWEHKGTMKKSEEVGGKQLRYISLAEIHSVAGLLHRTTSGAPSRREPWLGRSLAGWDVMGLYGGLLPSAYGSHLPQEGGFRIQRTETIPQSSLRESSPLCTRRPTKGAGHSSQVGMRRVGMMDSFHHLRWSPSPTRRRLLKVQICLPNL